MAELQLLDYVQLYLVEQGLVRRPGEEEEGPRPWLPPAFKHPPEGAIAPGDQKDQDADPSMWDDGLVLSIMAAPGIPPDAGAESRRIDGVEFILRGEDPRAIGELEAELRWHFLLGPEPSPGGRTDWIMAGRYVIQSTQMAPHQPLSGSSQDVFSFLAGSYLFETRVQ